MVFFTSDSNLQSATRIRGVHNSQFPPSSEDFVGWRTHVRSLYSSKNIASGVHTLKDDFTSVTNISVLVKLQSASIVKGSSCQGEKEMRLYRFCRWQNSVLIGIFSTQSRSIARRCRNLQNLFHQIGTVNNKGEGVGESEHVWSFSFADPTWPHMTMPFARLKLISISKSYWNDDNYWSKKEEIGTDQEGDDSQPSATSLLPFYCPLNQMNREDHCSGTKSFKVIFIHLQHVFLLTPLNSFVAVSPVENLTS